MLDKFFILLHADYRLIYIWIASNMHMQHLHLWLENIVKYLLEHYYIIISVYVYVIIQL